MSASERTSGADAFEARYARLFGERWQPLRAALLAPARQVAFSDCLEKPYYLDAASVEAALALPPLEGESSGSILDMCAAPGGKTLVLASRFPAPARITANELSRDRRSRLLSVLEEHLNGEALARVSVTGRDAARWSRFETDAYDRVLLDAPCSSERHVLSSPVHLAQWSEARVRNLAVRQWALLSGAFLVLRKGGFLVYATCALSPEENDGVVSRLAKKYPNARIVDPRGIGERTEFGTHVLPDRADGAGPIYYALVGKE